MAIAAYEDGLPQARRRSVAAASPSPAVIGAKKLAIWLVAAALPWAVIIGAVRLAVAALS